MRTEKDDCTGRVIRPNAIGSPGSSSSYASDFVGSGNRQPPLFPPASKRDTLVSDASQMRWRQNTSAKHRQQKEAARHDQTNMVRSPHGPARAEPATGAARALRR